MKRDSTELDQDSTTTSSSVGIPLKSVSSKMGHEKMPKRVGKRPGRKPSKIDVKAKLERSRQSARECRARKKLRYQYLEELVASREKAVFSLKEELEMYKQWCSDLDSGVLPDGLLKMIAEDEVQKVNDSLSTQQTRRESLFSEDCSAYQGHYQSPHTSPCIEGTSMDTSPFTSSSPASLYHTESISNLSCSSTGFASNKSFTNLPATVMSLANPPNDNIHVSPSNFSSASTEAPNLINFVKKSEQQRSMHSQPHFRESNVCRSNSSNSTDVTRIKNVPIGLSAPSISPSQLMTSILCDTGVQLKKERLYSSEYSTYLKGNKLQMHQTASPDPDPTFKTKFSLPQLVSSLKTFTTGSPPFSLSPKVHYSLSRQALKQQTTATPLYADTDRTDTGKSMSTQYRSSEQKCRRALVLGNAEENAGITSGDSLSTFSAGVNTVSPQIPSLYSSSHSSELSASISEPIPVWYSFLSDLESASYSAHQISSKSGGLLNGSSVVYNSHQTSSASEGPTTASSIIHSSHQTSSASEGPITASSIIHSSRQTSSASEGPITASSIIHSSHQTSSASEGPITASSIIHSSHQTSSASEGPITASSIIHSSHQTSSASEGPITASGDNYSSLNDVLQCRADHHTDTDSSYSSLPQTYQENRHHCVEGNIPNIISDMFGKQSAKK